MLVNDYWVFMCKRVGGVSLLCVFIVQTYVSDLILLVVTFWLGLLWICSWRSANREASISLRLPWSHLSPSCRSTCQPTCSQCSEVRNLGAILGSFSGQPTLRPHEASNRQLIWFQGKEHHNSAWISRWYQRCVGRYFGQSLRPDSSTFERSGESWPISSARVSSHSWTGPDWIGWFAGSTANTNATSLWTQDHNPLLLFCQIDRLVPRRINKKEKENKIQGVYKEISLGIKRRFFCLRGIQLFWR